MNDTADTALDSADLARLDMFAGLASATLEALSGIAQRRRLRDGEALVEQGGQSGAVFVVLTGRIALRSHDGGRATIVATAGPGDLVGWPVLGGEREALWAARAVGDTEVVELPAGGLLELILTGGVAARPLLVRLFGAAADQLEAVAAQLQQVGREGVITAG